MDFHLRTIRMMIEYIYLRKQIISTIRIRSSLFEGKQHDVQFLFIIPALNELLLALFQLIGGDFKRYSHIWFSCKQQKSEVFIRGFYFLFIRRHEPMLGLNRWIYLRIFDFKQDLILTIFVDLLFESIKRLPNLYSPKFWSSLFLNWLNYIIFGLSCCSSREICLMFFSLGVSQIASLIRMKR